MPPTDTRKPRPPRAPAPGCVKLRLEGTPKNREALVKILESVFGEEFQYRGKVVPSDKFPNHEFQILEILVSD